MKRGGGAGNGASAAWGRGEGQGGGASGCRGHGAWEARPKGRIQKHRLHPYASRRRCDASGIAVPAGGVALLLRPLRTPWPWASEGEGVLGSRAAFPAGDPRRRLIRKGAFGHELLVGCRDDERVSPANRPLFSGTAVGCSLVSVIDGASLGQRRGRPTQRPLSFPGDGYT